MRFIFLFFIVVFQFDMNVLAVTTLVQSSVDLSALLNNVYQKNTEIQSMSSQLKAKEFDVALVSFMPSPKLSLMSENLQGSMAGPMKSWGLSQEIKFPAKYYLMSSAESDKAQAVYFQWVQKKLQVRKNFVDQFVNLYAAQKIKFVLLAQKETLKEIARIAEARRASGGASQQDEMKAHMEQTKIEAEIVLQAQEIKNLEAQLRSTLGGVDSISIPNEWEMPRPRVTKTDLEIDQKHIAQSPKLNEMQWQTHAAQTEKTLSYFSYAPDFMVSYKKPYENASADAYSFEVSVTIPLWFFTNQMNEVRRAKAQELKMSKDLETTKNDLTAQYESLKSNLRSAEKLLSIYETSLIPQAQTSLNSSRAAYNVGRVSFVDLLDSERSYFDVKIKYYLYFSKYINAITEMEALVGSSISDLPLGEKQ